MFVVFIYCCRKMYNSSLLSLSLNQAHLLENEHSMHTDDFNQNPHIRGTLPYHHNFFFKFLLLLVCYFCIMLLHCKFLYYLFLCQCVFIINVTSNSYLHKIVRIDIEYFDFIVFIDFWTRFHTIIMKNLINTLYCILNYPKKKIASEEIKRSVQDCMEVVCAPNSFFRSPVLYICFGRQ